MAKKKKKKEKVVEEQQEKKKSSRGGNHPKHPKCPECNRALYKTMVKGQAVKKDDPFAFCRYEECKLYGIDQSGNQSELKEDEDNDENDSSISIDDCLVTLDMAFCDVKHDDSFI